MFGWRRPLGPPPSLWIEQEPHCFVVTSAHLKLYTGPTHATDERQLRQVLEVLDGWH